MRLSKSSLTLALDLIEDRINQMDVLLPRDADDLQKLLRCREEFKVTALTADSPDRPMPAETAWRSVEASRRPAPSIGLDVI